MANYEDLTNDELRDILREYDLATSGNKDELVARIERFEAGVPEDEEDDEPEDEVEVEEVQVDEDAGQPGEPDVEATGADKVVVRMTRENPAYEAKGHMFTQEHPFAVMDENDADDLVQNFTGFRPATRTEVARYYGRE